MRGRGKQSCRGWNGRSTSRLVSPMAERSYDEGTVIVHRGTRWGRIAIFAVLGFIVVLLIAIGVLWTQRRPIATRYLESEFPTRAAQESSPLDGLVSAPSRSATWSSAIPSAPM